MKDLKIGFRRKFHGNKIALERELAILQKKNPQAAASPTSGSTTIVSPSRRKESQMTIKIFSIGEEDKDGDDETNPLTAAGGPKNRQIDP